MSQDYLARIAALEDALRQKDSQLSLIAETESFLRSALARAEEKIENEEREIEHLRAQMHILAQREHSLWRNVNAVSGFT